MEGTLPQSRIDKHSVVEKNVAGVLNEILQDFKEYQKVVKDKYFDSIWVWVLGDKMNDEEDCPSEKYRSRAKRYVYRYFVQRELDDKDFF